MIAIRAATPEDIPLLVAIYRTMGVKEPGYFEEVFARGCAVFIASLSGIDAGFCIYNRAPKYSVYRALKIPEIQHLNVTPEQRRQGMGEALISHCEDIARKDGHDAIGISVGLFKDYGPAQRLYARLGYIPDGNGVSYDRTGVTPYQSYPMDDDLCLMMIKSL